MSSTKTYLPTEILRQIIHHLLPQLYLPELLHARKVNSLFNEEIIDYLINGEDLEELFTFLTKEKLDSSPWGTFPDRLKRLFLQRKLREHSHRPCAFTYFVQEAIEYQLGDAPALEDKDKLTEGLIDVVIAGNNDPSNMFHRLVCQWWIDKVDNRFNEPIEKSMPIILACMAILRGDCAELSTALRNGLDPEQPCLRFGVIPINVAAQRGNRDIAKTMVEHGCSMWYTWIYNIPMSALAMAAIYRNKEALGIWLEHHHQEEHADPTKPFYVCRQALEKLARRGDVELMEFFVERYPRVLNDLLGPLRLAVCFTQLAAVRWLFARLSAPLTPDQGRLLLLRAMEGPCAWQRISQMVQLLLELGVSPNGESRHRTPLQKAVIAGQEEIAEILLQYGADANEYHPRSATVGRQAPLMLAVRQRSVSMVRLLLRNGANRTYVMKRKRYTIHENRVQVQNMENALMGLGWEEEQVRRHEGWDYWVLSEKLPPVTPKQENKSGVPGKAFQSPT
ncbi:hypothetical protein ASPFODRAFT_213652, partial [Aspergillus luchuensis CBS 106.47]